VSADRERDEARARIAELDADLAQERRFEQSERIAAERLAEEVVELESALAQERARAKAMHLALRNVRALAVRIAKRGVHEADDAHHLLRFCADAGVVETVLRADEPTPPAPAGEWTRDITALLDDVARFFDPDPVAAVEHLAKLFHQTTGLLAPGKDAPMAAGNDDHEHRRTEYAAWYRHYCACLGDRARRALPPVPGEGE